VTEKLLPVVIAGQPELADRLKDEGLRQLKQRVALRCDLNPLSIQETASYISGRIRICGGDIVRIFTRDAVALIHERSRGIPRTISVICENALLSAFAADVKPIGRAIVLEVCRDFRLESTSSPETPAPRPLEPFVALAGTAVPPNGPQALVSGDEREKGIAAPQDRVPMAHGRSEPGLTPDRSPGKGSGVPLFGSYTRRKRF
jgi:hypothetical protein